MQKINAKNVLEDIDNIIDACKKLKWNDYIKSFENFKLDFLYEHSVNSKLFKESLIGKDDLNDEEYSERRNIIIEIIKNMKYERLFLLQG